MINEHPENIDNLLVKSVLGEATESEHGLIRDWISQSRENENYYRQFSLIWEQSLLLEPRQVTDENLAWQRFKERTAQKPAAQEKNKTISLRPFFKIAAAIVLLLGAGAVFYLLGPAGSAADQTISSESNALHKMLADGSDVYLNRNSKVTYSLTLGTDAIRKVALEGEAFFKVAPDVRRPFVITVNDISVKVLGTSFNIKSFDDRTEVIVATGKVEVSNHGKSVILLPGQSLSIPKNPGEWTRSTQEDELYQYYVDRKLIARQLPLHRVVSVLTEFYGTEIKIDEARRNEKITTILDLDQSLRHNLDVIDDTMNTTSEEKNGAIILE